MINLFKFFKKGEVEGEERGSKGVEHKWKHVLTELTSNHKKKEALYRCQDCPEYKKEIIEL